VSLLKVSLILFILAAATSCGPVKGYEGPDLPREQLGLLKIGYSSCDKCRINEIRAGSTSFFSRGVLLLPGKYFLQSKIVSWGEPYNCRTESYFDDAAYRLCDSDREEAIRKERSFFRDCNSEASKTKTVCSSNFNETDCSGGIEINSNQNWQIVAQTTAPENPIMPGEATLVMKPFFSAEDEKELTKLHTLEKPIVPEEQNISSCRVTKSGVW